MTSTVDVNVLVYAADTSSERHRQARRLLDWIATSPSIVYLFWPVLIGYVRIVTHPGIIESPLALDEALADIDDLSSRPQVITVGEDFGFWPNFRDAALSVSARGKLVPDAISSGSCAHMRSGASGQPTVTSGSSTESPPGTRSTTGTRQPS